MAPSSGTSYSTEVLKIKLIESSVPGAHISVIYLCGYSSGQEKFYDYNTCSDNHLLSTLFFSMQVKIVAVISFISSCLETTYF